MTRFAVSIARALFFYESSVNFTGVVWFGRELSLDVLICGLVAAVSGAFIALVPRTLMGDIVIRAGMLLACMLFLLSESFVIAHAGDYDGSVYYAAALVLSFIIVLLEIVNWKKLFTV